MPECPAALGDHDPIVIIDDDADFAALPAIDEAGEAYLAAQGIAPDTWGAFRVGRASPAALARLGLTGRRALGSGGVSIPTWLPDAPGRVVGIVRQNFAQNVHRFATAPAGIAGPVGIVTAARVVLVDSPLLALRLFQAGVAHVALVEDLAVLPALVPWLVSKEAVICASYRTKDLEDMREALAGFGITTDGHILSMAAGRMSDEVRRSLGLDEAPPGAPPPSISREMPAFLHRYAQGRLASVEAQAALAAVGITDSAVVDAYQMGYLPASFRSALPDADRRAITGRPWANALVIPAFDDQGAVVDLLIAQVARGGHVTATMWEQPCGLIAPTLTTAFSHVIVTDSVRRIGPLFRPSLPAVLLRGVEDARANAARLVAAGLERVELRVHREPDAMMAILAEVGIDVIVGVERTADIVPFPQDEGDGLRSAEVAMPAAASDGMVSGTAMPPPVPTPAMDAASPSMPATAPAPAPALPAPAPTLALLHQDAQRERASFRFGQAEFEVQGIRLARTVLDVTCCIGERKHRNRDVDLAVPRQRTHFAVAAATSTGLDRSRILVALPMLLEAVQALAQQWTTVPTAKPTSEAMSETERAAALAVLGDDRLLERLCADLDGFGDDGQATDQREVVILASVSALSEEPIWLALTAGSAGECFADLSAIAAITPVDRLVQASRLTDSALFNANPQAFRHKLLILDDVSTISQPVATALRILRTRGQLVGSQVERDALTGGMRTQFTAAHGPLALIAAAPGPIPAPLRHHLLEVPVDESADQVARTLAARRRALASPALTQHAEQVAARWRRILGVLLPSPVIIPAESEVALPPVVARSRPYQNAAFGLIVASALLHQHQRLRVDGAVVATPADIARGIRLATGLAASRASDLSAQARHLLAALWAAGRSRFTMDDLGALLPAWTRWTFRAALDELTRLDCIDAGRGGRGRVREYTLVATPASMAYDKAGRALGELAAVGGAPAPTPTREAKHA